MILPEESAWNLVETKLLVDDQDLIGPEFGEGPRLDPEILLGPDSPLLPEDEPREVMLAEAECTWGCCGAVFVRVSRDGDEIVWSEWPGCSKWTPGAASSSCSPPGTSRS